jgi:shikimate kinase
MERLRGLGKVRANVIIIGFAATGKTSVGRTLAERLGWDFLDTDEMVVKAAGKPIPSIIEEEGEEAFHEMEKDALEKACRGEKAVIAVGGGAVMFDENRELMTKSGYVVCLEAKPETIYKRLRKLKEQGPGSVADVLLVGKDPLRRISFFKEIRQPYYAIADWTVHTDYLTVEQVVEEIIHGLRYMGLIS